MTTENPQNSGTPGIPPTSGQVPQRTSTRIPTGAGAQRPAAPQQQGAPRVFSPTSNPSQTGAAPTSAPAPAASPQSAPQRAPQSSFAPTSTPSSAPEEESVFGAVGGKIKGFALKAKDELVIPADDEPSSKGGPRKARVLVSRIDPWSAMKMGFLLSIAAGIMLVIGVFIVWGVLNGMGVFSFINEWIAELFTSESEIDLAQFFDANRWLSASILVAVVNVVLLTGLATLSAFLYNVISSVVGGVYVTLTDD